MKKLLLSCAAMLSVAFLPAGLSAADSTYVRASAAWFSPADSGIFDDGELGSLIAVGRNFGSHSVEVEVGYVEFSKSQGGVSVDLDFIPLTLGYRYNFELAPKLTLGVGANAGVAFTEIDVSVSGVGSDSDQDTVFIASGGLRLQYELTQSVALSAGYRYVWVDDLKYSGGLSINDADTHVIDLGVEFRW